MTREPTATPARRVLVTGGAGFIGSHVVDLLLERGHSAVVLDNLDPQVHGPAAEPPEWLHRQLGTGHVLFRRGDVRDPAAVRAALSDVDTVIHLAAAVGVGQSMYEPAYYTDVNVQGQGVLMQCIVEHGARPARLVVASSMSIYGEGAYACAEHGAVEILARPRARLDRGEWEPTCPRCEREVTAVATTETKPLAATSIYAITKKTQEELALCFGAAYDIPTLALRFFNVFGPRQALSNPYTGVAAIFLSRLRNGQPPVLFEDGGQTRDFVHVRDVAAAVVRAAEAPADRHGVCNVCTGRPLSIRDVAVQIAEELGVEMTPLAAGEFRAGDIRHCFGSPDRARELIGFEARHSFRAGLPELIEWSAGAPAEDRLDASIRELVERGLLQHTSPRG